MGQLTISMAIFHSYFDITRGYQLENHRLIKPELSLKKNMINHYKHSFPLKHHSFPLKTHGGFAANGGRDRHSPGSSGHLDPGH